MDRKWLWIPTEAMGTIQLGVWIAVGENVTVTDISQPIEVSGVSLRGE